MNCPVCDAQLKNEICSVCGWDESTAYERYPTFTRIARRPGLSALRADWEKAQAEQKSSYAWRKEPGEAPKREVVGSRKQPAPEPEPESTYAWSRGSGETPKREVVGGRKQPAPEPEPESTYAWSKGSGEAPKREVVGNRAQRSEADRGRGEAQPAGRNASGPEAAAGCTPRKAPETERQEKAVQATNPEAIADVPAEMKTCEMPKRTAGGPGFVLLTLISSVLVGGFYGSLIFVAVGVIVYNLFPGLAIPVETAYFVAVIATILYSMIHEFNFRRAGNQLRVERQGDSICLTWPENLVKKRKWAVAINGVWVRYGALPSGLRIPWTGPAHILMAEVSEKKAPKPWKAIWFTERDL